MPCGEGALVSPEKRIEQAIYIGALVRAVDGTPPRFRAARTRFPRTKVYQIMSLPRRRYTPAHNNGETEKLFRKPRAYTDRVNHCSCGPLAFFLTSGGTIAQRDRARALARRDRRGGRLS